MSDAIAHAIDPPLLFSLHLQVEELEPSWWKSRVIWRIWRLGPRGTSGSSKKVNLGGGGELVSSPPSFSGAIS